MMRGALLSPGILLFAGCVSMVNRGLGDYVVAVGQVPAEVTVLDADALATVGSIAVPRFDDRTQRYEPPLEVFRGSGLMGGRMFSSYDGVIASLTERFEEHLLAHGVRVLERARADHLMAEQALTELSDDASPGRVLDGIGGADAVLVGALTEGSVYLPDTPGVHMMGRFAVHIRLIDARTGHILAMGKHASALAGPYISEEVILDQLSQGLAAQLAAAIGARSKK